MSAHFVAFSTVVSLSSLRISHPATELGVNTKTRNSHMHFTLTCTWNATPWALSQTLVVKPGERTNEGGEEKSKTRGRKALSCEAPATTLFAVT